MTDKKGQIVPTVLVEASCLVKFRKRIGPEGVWEIESILRDQMKAEGVISLKNRHYGRHGPGKTHCLSPGHASVAPRPSAPCEADP